MRVLSVAWSARALRPTAWTSSARLHRLFASTAAGADSPTVICVHGMHCTSKHFDLWRSRMEDAGLDVVTPTLRYHDGYVEGGPPPPPELGDATIEDYVDDVAAVVDSLGLSRPPVFVGHSMGAVISLKLLERGIGGGAALVAPASPANWSSPFLWEQQVIWHRIAMWLPFQRPVRLSPTMAAWGFFNRLAKGSPEREHAERNLVFESGRAAIEMIWLPFSWIFNLRRSTAIVDAARIQQPTSIYGGTHDRATPPRSHRRIRKFLGAATPYRLYDGRDHWLIAETEVCDDVIEWIGSISPPSDPA